MSRLQSFVIEANAPNISMKDSWFQVVTIKDWYRFFSFGVGNFWVFISFLLLLVHNGVFLYAYIILGEWTEMNKSDQQDSDLFYYYMGAILSMSISLFLSYYCLATVFYTSSKAMHQKMIWSVLRAPMHFFDKNSIGTILTKFSRDIKSLGKLAGLIMSRWVHSKLFVLYIQVWHIGSRYIGYFMHLVSIHYHHNCRLLCAILPCPESKRATCTKSWLAWLWMSWSDKY